MHPQFHAEFFRDWHGWIPNGRAFVTRRMAVTIHPRRWEPMELIQPPPAKGIGSSNGREVNELELMRQVSISKLL